MWRSRWAAIGAAVSVSLGAGGIGISSATVNSGDKPVTVTIEPQRILDTRSNLGLQGRFLNESPRDLQVTGPVPVASGGTATVVPADAVAAVVNVTVVNPDSNGYLSLRPAGATGIPTTATVNFLPGTNTPNAATADLGPGGRVQIFVKTAAANGTADVVVDVVGYTVDHTHDDSYYTEDEVDAKLTDLRLTTLGVNYADGDQFLPLTPAPQAVRSVDLQAPAAGFVIVTASGFTDFETTTAFPNGYDAARCTITDGAISFADSAHEIRIDDAIINESGAYHAFSATRTFPVVAGVTTFRLVCEELAGEVDFYDSQITALYVPNNYAP